MCVPIGTTGMQVYIPPIPPVPPTGSQVSTSVSGSTTYTTSTPQTSALTVNVDNATNVATTVTDGAVSDVTSAVQSAISQANLDSNQIALASAQTVAQALQSYAESVQNGVNSAFLGLGNVLNGVEQGLQTTLGSLGTTIGNQIFNALNPVSLDLSNVIIAITRQIGGLAGAIGQAVGAAIPAIIAAVTGAVSPSQAALQAISAEIGSSVAQLAQIGTDISGGFSGLDSTLTRLLTLWEGYNSPFVEAQTGYPDNGTLHEDLSSLAAQIAGIVSRSLQVSPKLSDRLTTICNGVDLEAALNKPVWDTSQPLWGLIPDYNKFLADLIIWVFSVLPIVQKVTQETRQRLDAQCPQDLLPPSTLVEAWVRGYLTEAQAKDEASKGNLGASRMDLLKDLATEQLSPSALTEAYYRGIITQDEYYTALAQQGYTGDQQVALQALGVSLLSTTELWDLARRGTIDNSTLDTALKSLRYDDAQRKALESLTYRPATMNEAIAGSASQLTLQQMGLNAFADGNAIPEFVQAAGAAEGLSTDAVAQRYFDHWNTGSVGAWITLYFRGQISLETLNAAFARQYIPQPLVTTLVESSRPLVQYRTIANMLRIGQLTVQQAGNLLLQHGYSPESVQLLITYAQRPGAASAAKKAQATHAVSLEIAKREYIDGSITENDYYQILLAHGYTIEGANAEIAVENANQAMLLRKENAQLVVDEYGSGLINEQTALAQLAALNLTVYELAKYTHKLKVFRVKQGKIPSETDLNYFLSHQIISSDTYKSQLVAQGYSDQAAGWFLQYRQAPAAASSTSGSATTAAPTGGQIAPPSSTLAP
jgi:hypothetical protein